MFERHGGARERTVVKTERSYGRMGCCISIPLMEVYGTLCYLGDQLLAVTPLYSGLIWDSLGRAQVP